MTSEELAKILETFAGCVIGTTMSDMSVDEQHDLICLNIDRITNTVMMVTNRNRYMTPSLN